MQPDCSVIEIKLETYLAGVVFAELGANAPLEALKAQAVASRTYAAAAHRHPEVGADVCTTAHCQEWKRVDPVVAPEVFRGVSETWGIVAIHEGKLIDAFFFEHCDGHTRDAQDLLMSPVSYLQSVECGCGFVARKGHGVGLCQRGAIVMARRGATFEQILTHYYHGVIVVHTELDRKQAKQAPSAAEPELTPAPAEPPAAIKPDGKRRGRKKAEDRKQPTVDSEPPGELGASSQPPKELGASSQQLRAESQERTARREKERVSSRHRAVGGKRLTVDSKRSKDSSEQLTEPAAPQAAETPAEVHPSAAVEETVPSALTFEPAQTEPVEAKPEVETAEPSATAGAIARSAHANDAGAATEAIPNTVSEQAAAPLGPAESSSVGSEQPEQAGGEAEVSLASMRGGESGVAAQIAQAPLEPEQVAAGEPVILASARAAMGEAGAEQFEQAGKVEGEVAAELPAQVSEPLSEPVSKQPVPPVLEAPPAARVQAETIVVEETQPQIEPILAKEHPATEEVPITTVSIEAGRPTQEPQPELPAAAPKAGEPPADVLAPAEEPQIAEPTLQVPSYIQQLNLAASLTADEISNGSPLSERAEPETPAPAPHVDAVDLPVLDERVLHTAPRVHIDHLPGPRMIAGCLSCAGTAISIEDARGNKLLVFSGCAPHYGDGGFETVVDEDGCYIVCIDDQQIEVNVRGGTAFIQIVC